MVRDYFLNISAESDFCHLHCLHIMCRFLVWVKGNLPSSSPFPLGGAEEIGYREREKGGREGKSVEEEENSGRGKRDLQ